MAEKVYLREAYGASDDGACGDGARGEGHIGAIESRLWVHTPKSIVAPKLKLKLVTPKRIVVVELAPHKK